MSYIEADCSLIKNNGEIIGVSLIPQYQTEAQMFCASIPRQLVNGGGDIKFEDGKITFVNPDEGEVSFTIENDDASALQAVFNGGQELGLYSDGIDQPGFKIVLKGMKNDGEKTALTRL